MALMRADDRGCGGRYQCTDNKFLFLYNCKSDRKGISPVVECVEHIQYVTYGDDLYSVPRNPWSD